MLRLHRAGLGYPIVSWAGFARAVELERPDAVSVDVFETCIVRDLAGDRTVDHLVQRRASRAAATIDPGTRSAMDAAAEVEFDLCRPVVGAAKALDRVRSVVGGILFVSDTERSSAVLAELLRRHGLFRPGDRLVASCEEGATKSSGRLYERLWENRPPNVWHVGNHQWSDGVQAAAHGLAPFDLPAGNLSRYEAALCRDAAGLGPVVAGAARSARLQLEHDLDAGRIDPRTFQLRRLGAQVAGPAMTAFAWWIAEQVQTNSIDHLGFLSRDGELPLQIAQRVPDPTLAAIPRSYLHINRVAVTLATASAIGVDTWVKEGIQEPDGFLRTRLHLISFAGLLQRLGFVPADVADVMGRSFTLASQDPTKPLDGQQHEAWLTLVSNPSVQELVLERSEERRAAIIDYLGQQGLLSAKRPAFVDVGWRGRMARLIDRCTLGSFANQPIHLHFGGDQVTPELDALADIRRFAFPGTARIEPFDNPPSPVETLTASGNPRVIDYRRDGAGRVEPVYQPEAFDVGRADRAELWRGARDMADRLPSAARIDSWELHRGSLAEATREVLRLWWYEPERDEAGAVRSFAFEGDEAGAQVCPVVAPYALTDIVGRNRTRRQWRQGSAALSPLRSRIGLRLALLARRAIRASTGRGRP
jgi:FMN phosphatase YigB (HAD superfamily)